MNVYIVCYGGLSLQLCGTYFMFPSHGWRDYVMVSMVVFTYCYEIYLVKGGGSIDEGG